MTFPKLTLPKLMLCGLGLASAITVGVLTRSQLAANENAAAEETEKVDSAMFGMTPARNMVNLDDKGIVANADPEDEAVVLWKAELGSRAYGGPTVHGGKVFVGTNNERPRNPRDSKKDAEGESVPIDMGILMCFDEKSGNFLWQGVFDKLPGGQVVDWPKEGICSTPAVEGERVYFVSNRCTVVCADVNGFSNGNQGFQEEKYQTETDIDIIWETDMIRELNVFPHNMAAGSPLIVGDLLFVITANGVDEGHINIPSPEAPSFLCLDKNTGKILWKRNDPGRNIMHGQWSNPTYADINGVPQVIFPGGDGWLYSCKPETGELLWKFDCNPKDSVYELGGTGTKNDFIGTPVVYDDKVYIGVGQDPEHFSGIGHFWCIDPSKATKPGQDLSPVDDNFDPKAEVNKDSGLVWHYGGSDDRKFVPRDFVFGRTMSTATIVDDILYIGELQGFLHCLDAKTGKKFWQYDLKGAVWGSTYFVDDKIYIATEGGDLFVFKHSKEPKTIDELDIPDAEDQRDYNKKMRAKRKEVEDEVLLHRIEFDAAIRSTPVAANGVLFVMTENAVYAFGKKD